MARVECWAWAAMLLLPALKVEAAGRSFTGLQQLRVRSISGSTGRCLRPLGKGLPGGGLLLSLNWPHLVMLVQAGKTEVVKSGDLCSGDRPEPRQTNDDIPKQWAPTVWSVSGGELGGVVCCSLIIRWRRCQLFGTSILLELCCDEF